MQKKLSPSQKYKDDFFNKLTVNFQKGKKILDVGCGDGVDSSIFKNEFKLETYATDIYEDEQVKKYQINFKKGSIYNIPFKDNEFDYVFTHDVLHHIDEKKQRKEKHIKGLYELRRVCKQGGNIIIVEANRYNPLFYPHMVLLRGHNHFTQSYFKKIIVQAFEKDSIAFRFFEAHLYPAAFFFVFKVYEFIMEHLSPKQFLAYNVAILKKK